MIPFILSLSAPHAALSQLVVTISHASGSPTAGQPYSLTCSVEVPHLVVEYNIVWTRQDGRPIAPSSADSPQLNFDPLTTSNGTQYTCTAFVMVSSFMQIHGSNSTNVVITSKLSNYFLSQVKVLKYLSVSKPPWTCFYSYSPCPHHWYYLIPHSSSVCW